jgi:hypothetical protein
VNRRQVLAYRAGLHGFGTAPDDALLDLGVQDTPVGSAALALSARGLPEEGLTTVWSFRGAPHRHRSGDLRGLATALWPLSDADARARLGRLGPALRKAGRDAVSAVRETAEAVAGVVGDGTPKGDLSAGVTKRIDEAYSSWCRGCGATHVNDLLLRLAALPGGARIDQPAPLTFGRIPRWPGVPAAPKDTARLLLAYLTLHGPATQADAAAFLGTTGPRVTDVWPEELVAVGKAWLPESRVAAYEGAEPARFLRLLPPSDPYLRMFDRALLVPDEKHRKALWPILGAPGAVVQDGEVAGLWRAKKAGKRLALTVTPFGTVRKDDVEADAARVAQVRGAASFEVSYDG